MVIHNIDQDLISNGRLLASHHQAINVEDHRQIDVNTSNIDTYPLYAEIHNKMLALATQSFHPTQNPKLVIRILVWWER